MNPPNALSFRLKLLLAMMLIVVAVTSATVYLAEKNQSASRQQLLDAQFQNQVRSFLAVQEARSAAITERCRVLSHSVRLRAALEESDVDDLYRNALAELQGILENEREPESHSLSVRASFFRFFDANGVFLAPGSHPAGLTGQRSLDEVLGAMGKMLRGADEQSVGYIALAQNNQPSALREVVLTKVRDWNGKELGTLVLGFPIGKMEHNQVSDESGTKNGIWLDHQLYLDRLSAGERELLVQHVSAAVNREPEGHFTVNLESGPHLLFYKTLDSETRFAPAYEVCLYPLAEAIREKQALRWKIIAFGLVVLLCGFIASLFISKELSAPVEKIVAGSVENLTRRRRAEEDLRAANRELEQALNDLKSTQRQVIQQERLRAIGQMASGIAHDFNNSLMPILGFSDLLLENDALLDNKEETRRCLELLRISAQDAANVVTRLREFYRPADEDEAFPVVDLTKIVEQAVSLTEPKWKGQAQATGATIHVVTNLRDVPLVAGQQSSLREVLTNLIFNAVDAMTSGGVLTLETHKEDNEALVKVSDTGMGMTDAVRQRCLEPFFSTKGERGTGLGLAMVYGIIERHRGRLEIESAPGKGTTFTIRLPLAPAAPISASDSLDRKAHANLNILVVDDDARVCDVVSTYLSCDGHRVATASSGREGLARFRVGCFDLVIADRAMPDMSGDQMAGLIKQVNPEVPVVLLTGFGDLIDVTGTQPKDVDVVLSKPVTLGDLRKTIEELLLRAA